MWIIALLALCAAALAVRPRRMETNHDSLLCPDPELQIYEWEEQMRLTSRQGITADELIRGLGGEGL